MKPLLFISPTTPLPCGHGLGMRAFAVLRALSRHHRVFLLVLNAPSGDASAMGGLRELCEQYAFHPAGLWNNRDNFVRAVAACCPALYSRLFPYPYEWKTVARTSVPFPFDCHEFGTVHVFRFYMIPVLEHLQDFASWEKTQLDIDDMESTTRRSLASMHRINGNLRAAVQLELEAEGYDLLERRHIQCFDRVFACSERDRELLIENGLHRAPEVLPNIVGPANSSTAAPHKGLRLLFVGSLGYIPNSDAVLYFCREVLPRVRERLCVPVTFDIVGAGGTRTFRSEVAATPGAVLHGYVDDLSPFYGQTDIVVAPIRAGGGTRIKILEAFAQGRPVVATSQGIQGIEARDGVHALVCDTPNALADACLRLHREPALREELTAHAARLLRERHCESILDTLFRAT